MTWILFMVSGKRNLSSTCNTGSNCSLKKSKLRHLLNCPCLLNTQAISISLYRVFPSFPQPWLSLPLQFILPVCLSPSGHTQRVATWIRIICGAPWTHLNQGCALEYSGETYKLEPAILIDFIWAGVMCWQFKKISRCFY